MRRIFAKVFILSLFIVLLAFIHKSAVFADFTITSTKDNEVTSLSPPPSSETIDENTKTVTITFDGLADNTDYRVALGSNERDWIDDPVDIGKPNGGTITINVCPDGKETLKLAPKDGNGQWKECGDGDYFWAGHAYKAALYRKDDKKIKNIIDDARFYVSHYYPKVTISPSNPSPNDKITVTIEGTRRLHDAGGRNNYKIEFHNQHTMLDNDCRTVHPDKPDSGILTFEKSPFEKGDYLIKINEQVHEEKGFFHKSPDFNQQKCGGGFTYYQIPIRIKVGGGSIGSYEPDPGGTDLQGVEETFPSPPLPCLSPSQNGGCDTVATAIGEINTTPTGFIKSIFSLILGLSGGIALLLIIYSGYKLMAARGEPEALQAARDQLISAIIGLIFIIFSLVILQIIGVDILKIPGFGK